MGHVDLLSRMVGEECPFLPDRASYQPPEYDDNTPPPLINSSPPRCEVASCSSSSTPSFSALLESTLLQTPGENVTPQEFIISTPPLRPSSTSTTPPTTSLSTPAFNPTQPLPGSFPSFVDILAAQRKESPQPTGSQFTIHGPNNVIFYCGKLWVPSSLRLGVLAACHIVPPLKHVGRRKMVRAVQSTCNWPNLQRDVDKYLSSCLICQRLRPRLESLQGQHLPTSTKVSYL